MSKLLAEEHKECCESYYKTIKLKVYPHLKKRVYRGPVDQNGQNGHVEPPLLLLPPARIGPISANPMDELTWLEKLNKFTLAVEAVGGVAAAERLLEQIKVLREALA